MFLHKFSGTKVPLGSVVTDTDSNFFLNGKVLLMSHKNWC